MAANYALSDSSPRRSPVVVIAARTVHAGGSLVANVSSEEHARLPNQSNLIKPYWNAAVSAAARGHGAMPAGLLPSMGCTRGPRTGQRLQCSGSTDEVDYQSSEDDDNTFQRNRARMRQQSEQIQTCQRRPKDLSNKQRPTLAQMRSGQDGAHTAPRSRAKIVGMMENRSPRVNVDKAARRAYDLNNAASARCPSSVPQTCDRCGLTFLNCRCCSVPLPKLALTCNVSYA